MSEMVERVARAMKPTTVGMNDNEKLKFIEEALEQGIEAMMRMASALRDMSDCLEDMTNHYAALVNSGDCGSWNPETESEVMAARKMVAEVRDDIAGLTFSQAMNTENADGRE